MAKDDWLGTTEGPLIDGEKDFSKSPNPMGVDESNVDFTETKAPKEASVDTPEEG